jgi:membrane protein
VEALISLATTACLFSLIFRLLPRARVDWKAAWVGGAVTAVLFTLGSLAITAYVTRRDMTLYGAASAIVMLMLWVHYSAHALFLGASFTVAHFRQRHALVEVGVE